MDNEQPDRLPWEDLKTPEEAVQLIRDLGPEFEKHAGHMAKAMEAGDRNLASHFLARLNGISEWATEYVENWERLLGSE